MGNMLFIKVIKSRKWKNNARNIILFRCSKALYFHTFSKMFLSKCTLKNIYNTPQICSGISPLAYVNKAKFWVDSWHPYLFISKNFTDQEQNGCQFFH